MSQETALEQAVTHDEKLELEIVGLGVGDVVAENLAGFRVGESAVEHAGGLTQALIPLAEQALTGSPVSVRA